MARQDTAGFATVVAGFGWPWGRPSSEGLRVSPTRTWFSRCMKTFIAGIIVGAVGIVWLLWKASEIGADAIWPRQPERI